MQAREEERRRKNAGRNRSTDAWIELGGTQLFVQEASFFFAAAVL